LLFLLLLLLLFSFFAFCFFRFPDSPKKDNRGADYIRSSGLLDCFFLGTARCPAAAGYRCVI
jgi:hypothetical protein